MQFLVDSGISPMDTIRAATSVAAMLIGQGDRLGTVEKGKLADLITVQRNPIDRIRRHASDSARDEGRRPLRHAVVEVAAAP